jgi:hypothetical protein
MRDAKREEEEEEEAEDNQSTVLDRVSYFNIYIVTVSEIDNYEVLCSVWWKSAS